GGDRRILMISSNRPTRVEPQLLQAKLEDVEEAARALAEARRLEQRLLRELVQVEVLREEVDERLVVDAALVQIALRVRPTRALEIAQHECADAGARRRRQRIVRRVAPAHHGLAIR